MALASKKRDSRKIDASIRVDTLEGCLAARPCVVQDMSTTRCEGHDRRFQTRCRTKLKLAFTRDARTDENCEWSGVAASRSAIKFVR